MHTQYTHINIVETMILFNEEMQRIKSASKISYQIPIDNMVVRWLFHLLNIQNVI